MDNLNLKQLYGKGTEKIKEQKGTYIYQTKQETGTGTIMRYKLFPGIEFHLMDLFVENIDYSSMPMKFSDNLITINHCHKGRFEGEFANGELVYIGEGDMAVTMPEKQVVRNSYPLGRFKGIIIILEIEEAKAGLEQLERVMGHIHIDFLQIKERLLAGNQLVIYRNMQRLSNIFSEMYQEERDEQEFYFKIKVLELFHYLSTEQMETADPVRYFQKNQVRTVKEIQGFLIEHMGTRYTLTDISKRFEISLTSLKECFKAIYGMPVSSYMRTYRLGVAEHLLRETCLSVADIAEHVGYANQSKFSEAFKQRTLMTPIEYRNQD